MADIKISALPLASPAADADVTAGVQSGVTVKQTNSALATYMKTKITLQDAYSNSSSPQITGELVLDDGSNDQTLIYGPYINTTQNSDIGVGAALGGITINGQTPDGFTEAAFLKADFVYEAAGLNSGRWLFNVTDKNNPYSIAYMQGSSPSYGPRVGFGDSSANAISNFAINLGAAEAVNANALLQINSTTQGFLPPVLTSTQQDRLKSLLGAGDAGLTWFNSSLFIPVFWDGGGTVGLLTIDNAVGINNVTVTEVGSGITIDTIPTPYFTSLGLGFSSGINSNAILQGNSTTQGFQPPQMTTAQMLAIPITSVDAGLTVYVIDGTQGEYICDGAAWNLTGGGGSGGDLQAAYDAGNTIALTTGTPVLISTQGAPINFAVYSNSTTSYTYSSLEAEEFTSSEDGFISALQYADPHFVGGSGATRSVGIYRSSDLHLMAAALVSKSDPLDATGFYRTHAITPVPIVAGVTYMVVGLVPANELWVFYARSAPSPFYYSGISYGQNSSSLVPPMTFSPTSNLVYYGNQSFQFTQLGSSASFNDATDSSIFTIASTIQGSTPWPLQSTTQFAALTPSKGLTAFDNVLNRPTLYDGTTIQTLMYQSDFISGASVVGNLPEFNSITGQLIDSGIAASSVVKNNGANYAINISGLAATATNANNIAATTASTNASYYPLFVSTQTGNLAAHTANGFIFNPSTNILSITGLNLGNLTPSYAVVTDGSQNLASLAYTSANTVSTLVERDSSGNFSAGTITAALTGNATTATSATAATNANNVFTTQVSSNASYFPLMVASNTNSNQAPDLATGLTYNPSTNILTTTGLNLTGLTASYVLTTDASKNLISSNTARIYPFGTSTSALDAKGDTGLTVISATGNTVAQLLVSNNGETNFLSLWSGRSGDVNPLIFWPAATTLRFGTCTDPTTTGFTLLYTFDPSGNFGSSGAMASTSGNITASNGNFVIGTNGKTLNYPLADGDKILFFGVTGGSKIDTASGFNFNFRAGNTTTVSSGVFNWYTVNASSVSTSVMSLSNTGLLSLTGGTLSISSAGNVAATITSTTTGSANNADLFLARGDQANGFCRIAYRTGGTSNWTVGNRSGTTNYTIFDEVNSVAQLTMTQGSGITGVSTFAGNVVANTLTLGGSAVSAPTFATQLNLASSTQNLARLALTGNSFANNTSTEGIGFILAYNATNNRQLYIVDTARVSSGSSTDAALRISFQNTTTNYIQLDALATDGSTALPLFIGDTGSVLTLQGNTVAVTGGNLQITTLGKTLQLATGTNACRGSVTLSGATTTVSTTAAVTGCLIVFGVSAVGGTQGLLSYTIINGTSFTITSSTGSLDTSTVQWAIFT